MTRAVYASDFESFRRAARPLIASGVRPDALSWLDPTAAQTSLFDHAEAPPSDLPGAASKPLFKVPRKYVEAAELAALVRADDRFALLYRVLFRLAHGEPHLLDDELDDDVHELLRRVKSVRHDEHRMHAFVRFRRTLLQTELGPEEWFVAWYRPEHPILRLAAPFFERRFASMRWSILTPDESVSWDLTTLRYGPGVPRGEAPAEDELEELYRTYYRSTYNPARANLRLFRHHVPQAFQRDMPELTVLSELTSTMAKAKTSRKSPGAHELAESAAPLVPASRNLGDLREAAAGCLACPLGGPATQTVFGEGAKHAKVCLIGEQPGDEEDRKGHPFIGPAGKVLDRAMKEVGLDRPHVYLTNAVKHFNYRPLGKKRLHQKPEWKHIEACRPWLRAELEAVKPKVIVCLGATAAQSFLGRRFTVIKNRGRVFETPWAEAFVVTYHPSAILRMPSEEAREEAYAALVSDLQLVQRIVAGEKVETVAPE
ncbi:MAG: phage polymerase-related protein [Myxococcaceae bacterium]|nr:phage polymerase-related protein [Myxococcaceae bacterium]